MFWSLKWLEWAPFATHWRDRPAALAQCIRGAIDGDPDCREAPDGYAEAQKRRDRHLIAAPAAAAPERPERPTPPPALAGLDADLRSAISGQKAISSGRIATVSAWDLHGDTLTFAGFSTGDIAPAEAKRDVLLQLVQHLDPCIQRVAFVTVPHERS